MLRLFLGHLLVGPPRGLHEIRQIVVGVHVARLRFHGAEPFLPEAVNQPLRGPDQEPVEAGLPGVFPLDEVKLRLLIDDLEPGHLGPPAANRQQLVTLGGLLLEGLVGVKQVQDEVAQLSVA